jgi:hypothetical protein
LKKIQNVCPYVSIDLCNSKSMEKMAMRLL